MFSIPYSFIKPSYFAGENIYFIFANRILRDIWILKEYSHFSSFQVGNTDCYMPMKAFSESVPISY